ncbi:hypothetical protein EDD15DRAFT_2375801 [Pisolithus albus]|nr:hypothetical protein EDD15DRAFT_2375801 [Pisolithus albus]
MYYTCIKAAYGTPNTISYCLLTWPLLVRPNSEPPWVKLGPTIQWETFKPPPTPSFNKSFTEEEQCHQDTEDWHQLAEESACKRHEQEMAEQPIGGEEKDAKAEQEEDSGVEVVEGDIMMMHNASWVLSIRRYSNHVYGNLPAAVIPLPPFKGTPFLVGDAEQPPTPAATEASH